MTFVGGLPSLLLSDTVKRATIQAENCKVDKAFEIKEQSGETPDAGYMTLYAKTDELLYTKNDSGVETLVSGGISSASASVDNSLVRFDLASGTIIQSSLVILNDAGIMSGLTGFTTSGAGNIELTTTNAGAQAIELDSTVGGARVRSSDDLILTSVLQDVIVTASSGVVNIDAPTIDLNTLTVNSTGNILKSASKFLHQPNATSFGSGTTSLDALTTGARNTAVGVASLDTVETGTDNLALGHESGKNLAATDSDNVMIANDGNGGDDGFVRIGASAQTDTFLVGNQWRKQPASTNLGDTAPTLTSAQIKTFILRGTPTAGRAWTLPTAALMITTDLVNPSVDDCLDFLIINEATAQNITLTIPADVTEFGDMVIGDAAALKVSAMFRIRLTNITPASEAYDIYRLS